MTALHRHKTAIARVVVLVLMCAWTNVFAQPCLMATGSGDAVTQAAEHDAAPHSMHESGSGAGERCDHCPSADVAAASLCASGINAGCGDVPDPGADGRKVESKLKTPIPAAAVHPFAGFVTESQSRHAVRPRDASLLSFAAEPPLAIRFCVFLK